MAVIIELTQTTAEFPENAIPTGYPIRFKAVGTGIPSEIFVFKDIGNGKDAIFSNIASLRELGDLATETYMLQENETYVPYFRTDEVFLILPNPEAVEETTANILEDIKRLIEDYKAFVAMNTNQSFVVQ
jgi:hypothetical protein